MFLSCTLPIFRLKNENASKNPMKRWHHPRTSEIRLKWVSLVIIAMLGLNGCGPRAAKDKTIGVTLLTKEHVFYRDLERGLHDSAREKGFNLAVTSGDWDLGMQLAQIENCI